MKKNTLFGMVAGFLVGTAASVAGAIAADKIAKEIKRDIGERDFVSPDGDRVVTLSFGSSKTAKGLTYIRVKATAAGKENACEMVILAKKSVGLMSGLWQDNDHFRLLVGSGKRKQCCDVSFDADEITANYYLTKNA